MPDESRFETLNGETDLFGYAFWKASPQGIGRSRTSLWMQSHNREGSCIESYADSAGKRQGPGYQEVQPVFALFYLFAFLPVGIDTEGELIRADLSL